MKTLRIFYRESTYWVNLHPEQEAFIWLLYRNDNFCAVAIQENASFELVYTSTPNLINVSLTGQIIKFELSEETGWKEILFEYV